MVNKFSHIDTVIFDLDGTLLDTLDDLTASVNYCMKKFHAPLHTREEVRSMVGNGIYNLMERALPGGRDNPDYAGCMAAFSLHYKEHMLDQTRPYEGIMPLLRTLQENGYKTAIVSNKFDAAVKGLNKTFFGDLIPVAIGENEAAGIAKKPAPDTVFQAVKELGSQIDTCLYVGDSDVDIQTAANAGMPCISVNWGFKDTDFLQAHAAGTIISDPSELLALLSVS